MTAAWGAGGAFFRGYYRSYCYQPPYIFCGEVLLCAKLRRSNLDASAGALEAVAWEPQLDLFADRTSSHTMRAHQLRLWFSWIAYGLLAELCRIGLWGTALARV